MMKCYYGYAALMSFALAVSSPAQSIDVDSGFLFINQNENVGSTSYHIGITNSGNGMIISNGVTVQAGSVHVGHGAGSATNLLMFGPDAQLLLSDELIVGVEAFSDSNDVSVTSAGSSVTVENDLVIGVAGSSNRMDISNSAEVVGNGDMRIGSSDSAMGNMVYVSGLDSSLSLAGALEIGTANNSGNLIVVTNGASVVADNGLVINGTGNEFYLADNGSLSVNTDFNASMTGFYFNEGGRLRVGGTLSGMSSVEGRRTLTTFSGTGRWSASAISVGATSSSNSLYVSSGGSVSADDMSVGTGSNTIDNMVSVTDDNSSLNIANSLQVGSVNSAGNTVTVSDGGKVSIGSGLVVNGANNAFNLGNSGWLVVSNDFDASANGFNFLAGGKLETTGILTGMTNALEDGRSIMLTGSQAVWNPGTADLYIGNGSAQNTLSLAGVALFVSSNTMVGVAAGADDNQISVSSGSIWTNTGSLTVGNGGSRNLISVSSAGQVVSKNVVIGAGSGSENKIVVSGAGSAWTNSEDIVVGGSGSGNMLAVYNGGRVGVGQNLQLQNQSTLIAMGGGQVTAANYSQDAASTFSFVDITNAADSSTELLTVSDTAAFENAATVRYAGTISTLDVNTIYTNLLVTADTLTVGGVTNTAVGLSSSVNGVLLAMDLYTDSNELYARLMRARLSEIAGFAVGSDMESVSDEIDGLASAGNPEAIKQLDILTQLTGSAMKAQLSQLYDRNAPTYVHAEGMIEGFRQVRQRSVMLDSIGPVGAYGPHFTIEQLQGWIKGYGSWGERDGSDDFSSYDLTTYGLALGMDRAYGDVLVGLAGGMADSDISQDDGDSSTSETAYGLVYLAWGTDWFADLNMGYGRSSIDQRSGTSFDTTADIEADQWVFYLGGGKELSAMDDSLIFTPSAALQGSYFDQNSYTEKASTAAPRNVAAYDRWSMQSDLGIKVSFVNERKNGVLIPEAYANWMHEFDSDDQSVSYSLVGGLGNYTFDMQAPIEDLYEVGAGLSYRATTKTQGNYELTLKFGGRFGDGYSANIVNAQVLFNF